jgi:diaminohydroxyphosphoribosylaminopyrimidine deaminase / 5-amino-6-(5-phosphoribosylamino)uracil reductase
LNTSVQFDEGLVRRALDLARQGIGLASPNPYVGAVLVDSNGTVVGEGVHTYAGIKHAEVLALEQAGELARGATLYINFEPCCHQGRTGPCADAIIKAGIKRVVACMMDPNPAVSGQGFHRLRDAGIEVSVGIFEAEARALNEGFAKYIRTGEPLITLKSAMTLDGKIAPAEPGPYHITGDAARVHVQQLRHQSDAILAGIGTVLADDPLLTDRSGLSRRRPLLRVVLDSHLRLPLESRLLKTVANDVLIFYSLGNEQRADMLHARGACLDKVPVAHGMLDIRAVMRKLSELQITSLLVEGGSRVNTAFLSSGLVDKVFLYYAPKILGRGVPFVENDIQSQFAEKLSSAKLHQFGEDFAIEGYVRDPYAVRSP